jgi:AcrR family transcriptional regulator
VRADAQRNVERILDAAVDALSDDVEASMTEVARRAGVARATVYVHYDTREALIDAVRERAFGEIGAAIADAEPEAGDPAQALRRVLVVAWRGLGRYHALVAITTASHTPQDLHARHEQALGALLPLIARGQRSGEFRRDVPPVWHLSMMLSLIHAASAEVRAGRIADDAAEPALVAAVLGALRA